MDAACVCLCVCVVWLCLCAVWQLATPIPTRSAKTETEELKIRKRAKPQQHWHWTWLGTDKWSHETASAQTSTAFEVTATEERRRTAAESNQSVLSKYSVFSIVFGVLRRAVLFRPPPPPSPLWVLLLGLFLSRHWGLASYRFYCCGHTAIRRAPH